MADDREAVALVLLEKGADSRIRRSNELADAALMSTVRGHKKALRRILDQGRDVNELHPPHQVFLSHDLTLTDH